MSFRTGSSEGALRVIRAAALSALLLVAHRTAARAQEPSAVGNPPARRAVDIVGLVRDTSGQPLPNVLINIAERGRATTTNEAGAFLFRDVTPGVFHLDARLLGYAPAHAVVTVPASVTDPEGTVRVTIVMRATPLRISGVQVTATPTATDPHDITQSTIELSGKELSRHLAPTVARTLANEPGMAERFAGPASAPVIRGLTGDRVLVLQDGQRTADLSSSSPDHALSADPLAATRIEVVRGPASLLYGNNALGGVVNVIGADIPNEIPGHIDGVVVADAGSAVPGGGISARVTIPASAHLAITSRLGFRELDDIRTGGSGTIANTASRNRHGVLGVGAVGRGLTGGVVYRVFDFDYGLPSRPAAAEAGVTIRGRRHELAARSELGMGSELGRNGPLPHLFTNVRVDGNAQWYGHDEVEPEGEIATRFRLTTQTANVVARTRIGRLGGAVGISGLARQYEPTGEEALTPAADTRTIGAFVYQELPLLPSRDSLGQAASATRLGRSGMPHLELGARLDGYRIESQTSESFGPGRTRGFTNLSASLGLSVPLAHGVSLGVNAARAFRAPTVEELFSNAFHAAVGAFDVGDPTLEAETSIAGEAVVRVQRERASGQFAAYYNRIADYIAPLVEGDTATDEGDVVPLNRYAQYDAALAGLEAQLEWMPTRRVVLGLMGDLTRGRFIGGRRSGEGLPYMPAARLGGSVRWDDGRYASGTEVRHAWSQRDAAPGEYRVRAYTLVDVHAGVTRVAGPSVHSITVRADNLFDVRYREATSRIKDFSPNPGRNVALVYRVLF